MTATEPAPSSGSSSIVAHQTGFLPAVSHVTIENATCVRVQLSGLHGAGKEMLLDLADWRHVSETISPWWQLTRVNGCDYVACHSAKSREIALRSGATPTLFLARYLAGSSRACVRYVNGDHCDLRRANLEAVTRSELSKGIAAARRAAIRDREAGLMAAMAAANAAAAQGTATGATRA